MFIDSVYNDENPQFPIKRVLRPGNYFWWDALSNDEAKFELTRYDFHDIDGRNKDYYTFKIVNYYYFYDRAFGGGGYVDDLLRLYIFIPDNYYKVTQYYEMEYDPNLTVSRRRALNESDQASLNCTTTKTNYMWVVEEPNDSFLFGFFFFTGQLGGLYTFLVFVFGL